MFFLLLVMFLFEFFILTMAPSPIRDIVDDVVDGLLLVDDVVDDNLHSCSFGTSRNSERLALCPER